MGNVLIKHMNDLWHQCFSEVIKKCSEWWWDYDQNVTYPFGCKTLLYFGIIQFYNNLDDNKMLSPL